MAIALELPGSIKSLNPVPIDWSYGPFADVATAKAAIPLSIRYDGLTVQVTGSGNYWWNQSDLTDTGLIAKGISSLTISPDELPKGSGSTLVHSGIFSTSIGNLDLGFGLTGSTRNINATGTATDVNLQFNSKGLGSLILVGNAVVLGATTYGTAIGNITIQGNQSSVANTQGGSVLIFSGQGNNGNASSGNIFIDTLAKTGSGIVGSISFFKQAADYGGGEKVIYIGNATTNPTTNPTGGGIMFVKSADNKPYWRTPTGVETVMSLEPVYWPLGGSAALTSNVTLTGNNKVITFNSGSNTGGGTLFINANYTSGGLGILAASGRIVNLGGNVTATQTGGAGDGTSHLFFTGTTTFGANSGSHAVINIGSAFSALNGGFTGTTFVGISYSPFSVTTANHYAAVFGSGLVGIGTLTPTATLHLVQPALTTTGGLPGLLITTGAHTNLTLSTELLALNINTSATVQYATGAQSILRNILIQAPTIGFVGASTVTDAATFTVNGAPTTGANSSITNSHGILIQGATLGGGISNAFGLTVNAPINATQNYSAQFLGGYGIKVKQTSQSQTHTLLDITQSIHTGGAPVGILFTGGAHTTLASTNEVIDVNFNLARVVQWGTNPIGVQRAFLIQAPTYAFVGASTISDAATVAITGAPIKGTNTTYTNTHALLIQAGAVVGAGAAFGLTVNAPIGGTLNYAAQFLGGLGIILATAINDTNGNPLLNFAPVSVSADQLTLTNGTTGAGPILKATSATSTDVPMSFITKGLGRFIFNSSLSSFTYPLFQQIAVLNINHWSTDTVGAELNLYKTRGAGNVAVATGDILGTYSFGGYDGVTSGPNSGTGSAYNSVAIKGIVNGTVSSGVLPADLVLYTTATNSLSERLRILSSGLVGINIAAPVSTLDILGSLGTKIRTITTSATAAVTDYTLLCDATGGVVVVTLPTASGATGRIYTVKKIDASANNVTLATVDGGTKTISVRYSGYTVQSDGSLWYIIASF